MKHTGGNACELCAKKLLDAYPAMVSWFCWVKGLFPTAHVSWSFRGKEDQDKLFEQKKTKLRWPESKHNFTVEGVPQSKALDLFELREDGKAYFEEGFYSKINEATKAQSLPIRWGGTFKNFKDMPHFELSEDKGANA